MKWRLTFRQIASAAVVVAGLPITLLAQTPEVGSGSPTQSVAQAFIDAYFRNGFNRLVSNPPLADVRKFGTIGLVQEFQDAAKTSGVRLALIKPNASLSIPEASVGVFQVQAAIYAYYNTIGVNNAGYPASDTMNCPSLVSATAAGNSCVYQLFDKPYALFAYSNIGQLASSTVSTRDPFYSRWNALGGIAVFGPPVAAEASITGGVNGGVSTSQTFDRGALYNITSGSLTGRLMSVKGDVYSVYALGGGATGSLGYPTGDEILLPSGHYRQSFEGGSIEYDPTVPGSGVLRPPVSTVQLTPAATSLRLNSGESYTVSVALFSATGAALTDRSVTWTTSNSRVIAVQANGLTATLRAVGGGSANVAATAEGKTSASISIFVFAPCCQIGEGSPTASIQQAFQDIVTRNRISVKLPAASPVIRVPAGYQQEVQSADGKSTYLLIVRAATGTGYAVADPFLARYLDLGGPSGFLGLPLSDAALGLQRFDGGALAGAPVQLVQGAILDKWASTSYSLGPPTVPSTNALTFRATSVTSQGFERGEIHVANGGAFAGKAYFVTGLIRAALNAGGGVTGNLGAPISEEVGINSRRRQDFEGGTIEYSPGDVAAQTTLTPRKPLVTATPATVLAGSTVRLAIGGFEPNATIRVSVAGRPDFLVKAPTGAYVWDVYVPANAATATTAIVATAQSGGSTAQATYAVRSIADAKFTLTVLRGDGQTGAPGALLAESLRVSLRDQSGNPAIGQAVTFAATPGAFISPGFVVTDANGEAAATLRMPRNEGVTLATASAAHQTVTFSQRSAAVRLANYPNQVQTYDQMLGNGPATIRQKGAMLAAFASMLRFYQDRGDAPSPNGLADPLTLNSFLRTLCPVASQGSPVCDGFYTPAGSSEQIVNLWRVPAFVGNALDFPSGLPSTTIPSSADALLAGVRDLVSQGVPVLIPMQLTNGATVQGSHFVVAKGVSETGAILIFDPNPAFGKTTLDEYIAGFLVNGQRLFGNPSGALLYFTLQPFRFAFEVISNVAVAGSSFSRSCLSIPVLDAVAVAGASATTSAKELNFLACDGVDSTYELDFAKPPPNAGVAATFRDFSISGALQQIVGTAALAKLATSSGTKWSVADAAPWFPENGVVNSASATADFAPGAILTIYGAGFGYDPATTRVEAGGVACRIVYVAPFQMSIQLPETVPTGSVSLRISNPSGTFERNLNIRNVAPGIFAFPGQVAITNQNGSLNSISNPATRGQAIVIYSTGLGITATQGNLSVATVPVQVVLAGQELTPFFAGGTPGIPGLYQVNVVIPATFAPGLGIPISLRQGTANSNSVPLAIQ